jgi:enoyl-CoA hydratase/carnithine racemase
MGFEQITYEVRDAVCTVTLNRPEKLNGTGAGRSRSAPST